MKKILFIIGIVFISYLLVYELDSLGQSDIVWFGSINQIEDADGTELLNEEDSEASDSLDLLVEHFIENNKTPFSKTVIMTDE